MQIEFTASHMKVNGQRVAVSYAAGPWVAGVDPSTIKVRPRRGSLFPAAVRAALAVENNSDSREDYFEADVLRFIIGMDQYEAVRLAAQGRV